MKLREYLNEMASGKDKDRIAATVKKAAAGQINQQGMIALGFDPSNPAGNNESTISQKFATRLGIKMTEDDFRQALKESGFKNAGQVVQAWNKTAGQKLQRTAKSSLEGSGQKTRF